MWEFCTAIKGESVFDFFLIMIVCRSLCRNTMCVRSVVIQVGFICEFFDTRDQDFLLVLLGFDFVDFQEYSMCGLRSHCGLSFSS